jgi:hypothetical protein
MLMTSKDTIRAQIAEQGYSIVLADDIPLVPALDDAWQRLCAEYEHLPPDHYLPDAGNYRYRRYDSFYFYPETGELTLLPHRDYFQSDDINRVTGGIVRKFAPLTPATVNNPFLRDLIRFDFDRFPLADAEMRYHPWQVDVHQIYVVAEPNTIGQPTPEGVHRDGAAFVTVHIAHLDNADGGIVTIYDDDQQPLASFQLQNVLDSYLFNDAILWHGVTPITSHDGTRPARRGILTFDYHYKPHLTRIG